MTDKTLSKAQSALLDDITRAGDSGLEVPAKSRRTATILVEAGMVVEDAGRYRCAPPSPNATPDAVGVPQAAPRAGTKAAMVIEMLGRAEGATVSQMSIATDWLPHSVRGFLAGALKKTHGLGVVSEPAEGGRIYRLLRK